VADHRRGRGLPAPVGIAAILVAVSLVPTALPASAGDDDDDLIAIACSLPVPMLERVYRGWNEDRGPELMWFPAEPDFVGSGLPHVGAWDYIQHIPMFWYGPGHIRAAGSINREVTLADIAPTQAALTGFPFTAPDGAPMTEALEPVPEADDRRPPRLIVVIVWDAAGRNVLEEHRGRWPYLESLIPEGAWFDRAFVGTSPTSTAQTHATIGTGAFPRRHGIVGHRMRIGGELTVPWKTGPWHVVLPTFADLYDRAMDNRPVVGVVATLDIHFGMMSHGAFFNGGDRDIVLTRTGTGGFTLTDEGDVWNLRQVYAPYYRLAGYANNVGGFEKDKEQLDLRDGRRDGKWRDNDIEQLLFGFNTPARSPYQARVVERVIEREGFGQDDIPDLLFTNFKPTDYVSHVWSMNSSEMGDAVEAQDRALAQLVDHLDRTVGEGEWVLALTADHASMPDPSITGAFQVSTGTAGLRIQEHFDHDDDDVPVVDLVHPTAVFLNEAELAEHGFTLADVARFGMQLTKDEVVGKDIHPAPGTEGDRAFPVAFPSRLLERLPCLAEEPP
jgi:hypothetical protein